VEARELATIRTGRAQASSVEHLRVDYYGTPTPLVQMATIAVPDARTVTIQPWDRAALEPIEKAIQKSDLGITPNNDGSIIRLNFPQLTQQRRQDLVKTVRKRLEDGKVALRNVRREAQDDMRGMEKRKEISEDEHKRADQRLQKLLDSYVEKIDATGKAKEAELMEI
ncbi:MAG: ribosome recycling factor, partial [Dehalococcoidia bacterium]|nr:ribosome recycling factor [Dehalococcoidia bacterium]